MQIDPYAAPKANVADTANQANVQSRPWSVRFAICFLWLSLCIDVIQRMAGVYDVARTRDGYSFGWIAFLVAVWLAILTRGIWRGKNWARSILLVFSLIGFLGLLASKWGSLKELSFYGTALLAINLLVQAAALWLLYAGSGGEWFRLRKYPS